MCGKKKKYKTTRETLILKLKNNLKKSSRTMWLNKKRVQCVHEFNYYQDNSYFYEYLTNLQYTNETWIKYHHTVNFITSEY